MRELYGIGLQETYFASIDALFIRIQSDDFTQLQGRLLHAFYVCVQEEKGCRFADQSWLQGLTKYKEDCRLRA